jgi:hypothetical protein
VGGGGCLRAGWSVAMCHGGVASGESWGVSEKKKECVFLFYQVNFILR